MVFKAFIVYNLKGIYVYEGVPMIRKRLIIMLQGIIFILLLAISSYILSNFYSYSLENFQAKCQQEARFAQILLTDSFTSNMSLAQKQELVDQLGAKLQIKVQLSTEEPGEEDEDIRQALQGKIGTTIRTEQDKSKALLVAVPLPDKLVLRTTSSLAPLEKGYEKIRNNIILAIILLMLLTFFLIQKLMAKQTAPLEQLTEAVKKWSLGDRNYRLPQRNDGEYGALAYAYNNMADETAEKLAEIQWEKHKSQLILDNMDNGVAVINEEGNIKESNKQFASFFPEQQMKITDDILLGFIKKCLVADKSLEMTFSFSRGSGKKVFTVFGAPLTETFQQKPTNVLIVFHDITALQAIYEKQADFVSNASHELATPLTTIRGFAETLLEEDTGNEPVLRTKFLKIILEEVQRMQALIKDLLQLAKLESKEYRQSIEVEEIPVAGTLEVIEQELGKQAALRDLTLRIKYENAPGFVLANKTWVKQILLNLTENALKYTPAQGQITLSCNMLADFAQYTIHNTGEGLSEAETQRIFDRFYRVDKARSRKAGGTGLGLSIVKFIVTILGGELKAESAPGQGVSFIFTLPRVKEQKI